MTSSGLHQTCPVCSSPQLYDRFECHGYAIARCQNCSLLFVRNIVTVQQLKAYYEAGAAEDYVYCSDSNSAMLNYCYARVRSLIEHHCPAKGKILDIGCNAGQFLCSMDAGWDRFGTEIAPALALAARQTLGDRIHVGSFETYPMRASFFDVISLQDVLDHFADPRECLTRCYAMLKPGGIIVVKVHNVDCLFAKLSGSRFYAIVPPCHLFFFGVKSLDTLLQKTGFRVLQTAFIPHKLQVKTVFYRLARGNRTCLAYRLYTILENSHLGRVSINKNLHDVITVIAVRD